MVPWTEALDRGVDLAGVFSFRRVAEAAALVLLCAPPAPAQTIRGRVVDSVSGEPVTLAYVGLLTDGQDLAVAALAGSDGDFTLRAPSAGSYFLYVARTGYRPLIEGVFELGADGVLEIRVGLKAVPIALEPLVVVAERDKSPLERVGFYERAGLGLGRFLIREEIERTAIDKLADAFRNIPRLHVITPPLLGFRAMQNPELRIQRGSESCSPTLYVDGAIVAFGGRSGRPVRPDDYASPGDVEAIEVYLGPSQVPIQFEAIDGCGVVLIWTRIR